MDTLLLGLILNSTSGDSDSKGTFLDDTSGVSSMKTLLGNFGLGDVLTVHSAVNIIGSLADDDEMFLENLVRGMATGGDVGEGN